MSPQFRRPSYMAGHASGDLIKRRYKKTTFHLPYCAWCRII